MIGVAYMSPHSHVLVQGVGFNIPKGLNEASETHLHTALKAHALACTSKQKTLSKLLKQSQRSSELTPTVHGTNPS